MCVRLFVTLCISYWQGESTPSAKGPAKPPKVHYKGPLDVASKVWATEGGLRGIYKGLVPTLAREVPGNALMFGAYEALKRKARDLQVRCPAG